MGGLSLIHWIIVGAVLLLLFGGRGKISDVMGDVAKGIKSFKKGLSDEDDEPRPAARPSESIRTLDHQSPMSQPVSHAEPTGEPRKVG